MSQFYFAGYSFYMSTPHLYPFMKTMLVSTQEGSIDFTKVFSPEIVLRDLSSVR